MAPLAGIVVERNLNPGMEFRPEGRSGARFALPTRPGQAAVDAGEADLAALKPGEELSLEVKAYPGERFAGRLRHVADFIDPARRTVRARRGGQLPERRLKGSKCSSAPASGCRPVRP